MPKARRNSNEITPYGGAKGFLPANGLSNLVNDSVVALIMTEDFSNITLYSSMPASKATTAFSRKCVFACSLSVCLLVCLLA